MTDLEAITAAAKLISNPQNWTSGALARTKTGDACAPNLRRACRWDASGAIYAALRIDPDDYEDRDLDQVARLLALADRTASRKFRTTLCRANDNLGHDAVMQIFRAAYAYRLKNPEKTREST